MLRGVKLALVCAVAAGFVDAALEDVPSFAVPSFDYGSLQEGDVPSRMLGALERGGIIALKNIPNYSNVRERFLASAVQCAVASENTDEGLRYLSSKKFNDGTRRLTLRAAAGRELLDTDSDSLNAMAANCPGHRELYEEFSGTLERAVDTFASALDQTEFTMGDGERPISARKLVGDAKRLDHFHAYEAAPATPSSNRRSLSAEAIEQDLSLAMHEDHGLFIAMAAPKFYSVNAQDGSIHERRLKSDASGLVIGAAELDEIVRPELKADELVIMIGTGASRWLQTSHHLPAVMHGMRMPEEMVWDDQTASGQRNLRAWFGKMTLMPSYQRLLESDMDFDEFTNRTTRHLKTTGITDDLKAIGCAGGRHLVESEGSCTYSVCTLKPGVEKPPTVGCKQACNYHTEFFDAKCEKKCDCTGTTTQADVCWMLCVARLPVAECALEDQACSGLKMICAPNGTNETIASHSHGATTEAPTTTETLLPNTTTEAPAIVDTPLPTTVTEVPAVVDTPLPMTITSTAPEETTATPLPISLSPSTETPQPAITTAAPATITPTSEAPIGTQPTPVDTPAPIPATSIPISELPVATQGSLPATNVPVATTTTETLITETPLPATTAPMAAELSKTAAPPASTITPIQTTETPLQTVTETPLPATTAPTLATELPKMITLLAEEPVVPAGYC